MWRHGEEGLMDKDALEEEPIDALIREIANDPAPAGTVHGAKLLQIADAADRREREWRRLYASMKKQRDAVLCADEVEIVIQGNWNNDMVVHGITRS
jgi:hypothetical protein